MYIYCKDACKLESDEFDATAVFPEGQLTKMGKKAMGILGVKVYCIHCIRCNYLKFKTIDGCSG